MKQYLALDCYNHKIHSDGIIGTVVPNFSRWGLTNGWKIIEIDMEDMIFNCPQCNDDMYYVGKVRKDGKLLFLFECEGCGHQALYSEDELKDML